MSETNQTASSKNKKHTTKKSTPKKSTTKKSKTTQEETKIKLIPLGGLGEVGKNMTLIEMNNEIIVIDGGLAFPEDDMLGIDIVIPDMTYLFQNKDKVKAVFLTHGHEDHIGAMPYLLKELDVPVYGTKLTLGLLKGKLEELKVVHKSGLHEISQRDRIEEGAFAVEFFRVNHSIPDAVGIVIHTPIGSIVHTGDFKMDQTPVDGERLDVHKLAELGNGNVLLLMSDSTNAERPGYTMSEKTVGSTINDVFASSNDRIIVATFSSNVHRIQQVVDAATKYDRKIAFVGRSMENVVKISTELGYLNIPKNVMIDIDSQNRYPANKVVIVTTGSQGEPLSALTRMSVGMHRKVSLSPNDTVLISATPVPGNEKMVGKTINNLYQRGVNVVYGSMSGVHVSGHASSEELKMMLNLVRPKYFMPVHGEYRHLINHRKLAMNVGLEKENIFLLENGNVLSITDTKAEITGKVTAGRTLIDGLGVGDVGNIVLRDRKLLSEDGIMVVVATIDKEVGLVSGPDIVSRGFVYVRESESLMENARSVVVDCLEACFSENIKEWSVMKTLIRQELGQFLYEKTRRKPIILPILMEV